MASFTLTFQEWSGFIFKKGFEDSRILGFKGIFLSISLDPSTPGPLEPFKLGGDLFNLTFSYFQNVEGSNRFSIFPKTF